MSATCDRAQIRRKARDLFDGLDGRRSATDVVFELKELCGLHRSAVRESGRSEEAVRRLGGVVREFAEEVSRLVPGGLVDRLGRELGETLAAAFRRTEAERDAELREQLLIDMWALVEVDFDRGRTEFVSHLGETFCRETTPEERDVVTDWFRERLEVADVESEEGHLIGHWMLEYVGDRLSDDEVDAVCRESGQYGRLVERSLEAGRLDEAVNWVREAPNGRLVELCRAFREHDRWPALVEADVLPHPERASIPAEATRDVAAMLLEAGAAERAIPWIRRALRIGRLGSTLRELRQKAEEAGSYDAEVERVMFEKSREWAPEVVFEVRLEFGELGRAVEVWEEEQSQWHADEHRRAGDTLLETAKRSEATEIAVAVATAQADILVARRGRDQYADACEYLGELRRFLERDGGPMDWDMVIEAYRERMDRLPAFRDEAEAAGLVS